MKIIQSQDKPSTDTSLTACEAYILHFFRNVTDDDKRVTLAFAKASVLESPRKKPVSHVVKTCAKSLEVRT